jgi:LSD1 subclass zinc finger protein
MGKKARARAARLAPDAAAPPVETAVAPLVCPSCGAPVPLGPGDVMTCVFCKATVPLPDEYRAVRDAQSQESADRDAAEALYRKLGKPPSTALRAWVSAGELLAGATLAIIVGILYLSAALIFLAGFALELVMHWIAPLIGIDFIDRFGGGTAYMGFAIAVIGLGLFPKWLVGYLDASAAIRHTLQASLAARPPEKVGFPSTCRACGAALAVPPGALGVRCAYCQTDNLVALPREWVRGVAASQDSFHRSIVEADARARALRAEARAGLPSAAKWCAIVVLVFGGVGRCAVSLDHDTYFASFGHSMGPPRVMGSSWDADNDIPIDTLLAVPNFSPYTVALHRHEVLELTSTDGNWCVSVSAGNTTTFPFLTRSDDVAWEPQTDGTYAARYRAPYTGLFEITIEGLDHGDHFDHLRWRIGAHSTDGLPKPPPLAIAEATVPPPVPLSPVAQALAQKIGVVVGVNPPGRPDLFATGGIGEHVDLYSIATGEKLFDPTGHGDTNAFALSPDGRRLAIASKGALTVWGITDVVKDSKWNGTACPDTDLTALAFVGPHAVAGGNARGDVAVWSTESGMELYRVGVLPGAVTSLAVSPDGLSLIAGYAGGARRFTVARAELWSR